MKFSVSDAQKRVGDFFPILIHEELEPDNYAGRRIVFMKPAYIEGSYTFDGKAFHVSAEAEVAYETECARCTKKFVETLQFPINETFVRDIVWNEDDDSYSYTSEQIDLRQAFYDNLYLHLPIISLCKSDCKGLCPKCGRDLNEGACDCQSDYSGPFGALKTLLNENKEV